ncbi:MAG: hypothetical protein JST62_12310 [Bacteroidetes bacterium]|nr:hypothetical protein [Bacteroidota bacterium]
MNFTADIFTFLKLFGKVSIPGFGVFKTIDAGAFFDENTKSLLPPSQLIVFNKNLSESDNGLVQFLAKNNNISPENIENELKETVAHWNISLQNAHELDLESLGKFSIVNNDFIFVGNRLLRENSAFFGLEEIKLSDVQKPSSYKTPKNSVTKQKSTLQEIVLWIFLTIIPIVGLLYFGITNQELIFGKKSFEKISIKNSTHRIAPTTTVENSLKTITKDTLQKDSLKASKQPSSIQSSHGK